MCVFPHCKVEEQPASITETSDDKGAVAIVNVPQLCCVSQDSEPAGLPKSGKFWDQFDEYDSLRYVKQGIIENKGPSLGKIQVKAPHQ